MTLTASPLPSVALVPSTSPRPSVVRRPVARHSAATPVRADRAPGRGGRGPLGRYTDPEGRPREVVARPGFASSVLVVDRDAITFGDRRLVAHLAADEPSGNAELVCRRYLEDSRGRPCRRAVTREDLEAAPFAESAEQAELASEAECPMAAASATGILRDGSGRAHRLGLVAGGMSIPELRWLRCSPPGDGARPEPVSVREAIAALESYEPVRALTLRALARHGNDPRVSVTAVRAELERVQASRTVLNRGLREAVLAAVQARRVSMSEVAIRCGRIKYDHRGNASGETSWLARRLGIMPEGGVSAPTPWVHSDVLALVARRGLGIDPREVELG
jgi:hypothetical protein